MANGSISISELVGAFGSVASKALGGIGKFVDASGKMIDVVKNYPKAMESALSDWAKIDENISKYGRSIGATQQELVRLREDIIFSSTRQKIGLKYNIDESELIESITNFKKNIGRDVSVGVQANLEDIATTVSVFGKEGAGEILKGLEQFGIGVKDSTAYSVRMFETARKSGLAVEKYASNVAKNMKIAAKYGFEDGIKGLERMVKSSMTLGMNLENATRISEKIIGGSDPLSAAIEMGAGLQTLGGNFAAISNPLALLNASINDIGQLQDDLAIAVSEMSTFNNETGELEINNTNKLLLRNAAQRLGVSYDDMVNGAMRQGMISRVNSELQGYSLGDNIKELLANKAIIEGGQTKVESGGRLYDLKEIAESKALQEELLQENIITGKSDGEKLSNIAISLRSIKDILQGFDKNARNRVNNFLEFEQGSGLGGGASTFKRESGTLQKSGFAPGSSVYGSAYRDSSGEIVDKSLLTVGSIYQDVLTGVVTGLEHANVIDTFVENIKMGFETAAIGATAGAITSLGEFEFSLENFGEGVGQLVENLTDYVDKIVSVTSSIGGISQPKIGPLLSAAEENNNNSFIFVPTANPSNSWSQVSGRSNGGEIIGPGSETSDSILSMLSNHEFVVRASEAKGNRALLESINRGGGVQEIIRAIEKDHGISISRGNGDNVDISSNTYTPVIPSIGTQSNNNSLSGSMDINVNMGDFRLEVFTRDGNSTNINLTELTKNPQFEEAIINLVKDNFIAKFVQGNRLNNLSF